MDTLHEPLVEACKVVAAGNRLVLQPENQGGSFIEDARSKRRKRIFERNGVYVLARVLGRQANFTKAASASAQAGRLIRKPSHTCGNEHGRDWSNEC